MESSANVSAARRDQSSDPKGIKSNQIDIKPHNWSLSSIVLLTWNLHSESGVSNTERL